MMKFLMMQHNNNKVQQWVALCVTRPNKSSMMFSNKVKQWVALCVTRSNMFV